jgi:hypothetical protein
MANSCVEMGKATVKDLYFNHNAMIPAQRPLDFRLKLTMRDESMPVVELAPELLWASIELMRNMALGHDVDSLAQFFASLTFLDCSALSIAIKSAAELGRSTIQPSFITPNAFQGAARDDEGDHSQFWAMETGTASCRTTFDPVSRCRRAIIANACQASFYGIHPEEFQARCASRELPFPMNDEDAVAVFIYASVGAHFKSKASAIFLRFYMGGKGCSNAVLLSARRKVELDAFGRICEVRPVPRTALNVRGLFCGRWSSSRCLPVMFT